MLDQETSSSATIELATELSVAWLSNPNTRVATDEAAAFLSKMHQVLTQLTSSSADAETQAAEPLVHTPAVSVRKSLADPDHIISLIDGKPYKSLKRHLSAHGLTPEAYRQRYGLKPDYPMVSPSYARARREVAKKIGLGRRFGEKLSHKGRNTGGSG